MPEGRRAPAGWLLLVLAVVLAGGFAYLNSAERVSLHLGLFVLFRVPLAILLFVVFLLGMGSMFLIGLRQDLKVRRLLREHRIQAERRPWETEAAPGPPGLVADAPRWDDLTREFDDGAPPRREEEVLPPVSEEPGPRDGAADLVEEVEYDHLASRHEEEGPAPRRPDDPGA